MAGTVGSETDHFPDKSVAEKTGKVTDLPMLRLISFKSFSVIVKILQGEARKNICF